MNSEFQTIISELEQELVQLDKNDDLKYNQAFEKVVELQKEVLSASLIGKTHLENKLKSELKQAELSLFALKNNKPELEQAYLYKYIKEKYD